MPLRRWIALLMLLLVAASSVESVVGVLRDGEVHHESVRDAAAHTLAPSDDGEHGHEDGSLPGDHQHGPGHQHGTLADHCTHQHGTPLLRLAFALPLPALASLAAYPEPPVHTGGPASSSFRPPRA